MSISAQQQSITPVVPLLDLRLQYREIEAEVMQAIREVCASQAFILGARVEELEARIAEYSQCKYGVGVSSGTDALLVALMALEVGPGDEVITTPYTFFATGGAISRLGARPLFCDIDPATYNISPDCVEEFIVEKCEVRQGQLVNKGTGGHVNVLLPVHLFGQMADMERLMEIADRHGLKIVEDAAQAIGSEDSDGRRAGSIGNIGCFSFFPSKNLGAFGDGGMCTTNDPALAERLRVLRVHGAEPKYHHTVVGGNFRLDSLQAAILLVKLRNLDRWISCRQENARYYDRALREVGLGTQVPTPQVLAACRHIFNQYVLRVERRDELRTYLADRRIGTAVYYPIPLHMQKCFASLGYQSQGCPESCLAAAETLAIPIYPELTELQKQHVVQAITEFYL